LVSHYHGLGREREAIEAIGRLERVGRGEPHLKYIVGSCYIKLGNFDEAIRQYQAGIQTEPKEKNYYRKRIVETLILSRRYADAGRAIESVVHDNPQDPEARLLQSGAD